MSNAVSAVMGGIFAFLGFIIVGASIGILMSFPIKWCWNYTMPYLFALPTLTWGKAWCLAFLANILFKSSTTTKS